MRKSTIYLFVLGAVVAVTVALASAGFVASAQNSNSSMSNMNMAKPKMKRHRKPAAPAKKCDPTQQEQTDLSGTYVGKATHGKTAPVDATLTITGNSFTMSSGSETHSGRITAVTTCGYTAVTMMMGDMTPVNASPNPPPMNQAMSMRAKKMGDKLMLTSVPGEPMSVKFVTNGMGGMGMKPRKHRSMKKTTTTAAPAKTTP